MTNAVGPYSISLQWQQPESVQHNITYYNVTCESDIPSSEVFSIANETSVLINELMSNTTYSCSIRVYSEAGRGPNVTISATTAQEAGKKSTHTTEINLLTLYVHSLVTVKERLRTH